MIIITIPAYNEEKTIARVIKDIKTTMAATKYKYKILVTDDGSKDNTAKIAKDLGAIVVSHQKNYGLSETFNTETKNALKLGADIIVHIDADCQYLAKEILLLIKKIEKGYDLVLGSRFKGKIEYMPLIKRIGNIAFSRVISNITKFKISDSQTGFRAFTKDVAKNIKISSTYTYTQEQVIKAIKNKYRVAEIPVTFLKRHGKSKLMKNPFDFAIKAGVNLIRIYRDYEPLKFFGFFGGLLFSIGFIIGIVLISIFIKTGAIGHVPALILSVLLMLIGFQTIFFGFLADMNRK